MIDPKIRMNFPILKRKIHGKPLIYFDNAATTQKPKQVIDEIVEYYSKYNSNVHRSVHMLGEEATNKFEEARKKAAKFIGASQNEIIFTKNATESLNLISQSLNLKSGDEVISTVMEHHSNIVPWQSLKENGVKVKYIDITDDGKLKMEQYSKLINKKTKVITIAHASNVLGTINEIKNVAKIAHENGIIVVVDGAQSIPHMPINVRDIECDFFVFSGHKMLGPTGIGAMYGKKDILNDMQPFLKGGDMIKSVSIEETTYNDVPYKFEAGTPNVSGAIALGVAIDYLTRMGMKNVRNHEIGLTKYALSEMSKIEKLKIYGPSNAIDKSGIVSFNVGDIHSHDLATILDEEGIAIRSGHGCAMPLMNRLGCNSVARASFYIYNTKEEIDIFINALQKAKKVFKL